MAIGDYVKTEYNNGGTPAINAANLNNAENKIEEIDLDYDAHKSDNMPHKFVDNSTTYNYGIKAKNGELIFMYEEAI